MAANRDLLKQANGIRIGERMDADIEEMWHTMPVLPAGLEATRGWAFCHAPEVTWPALGTEADDNFLKPYVEQILVPLRWEFHIRRKKVSPSRTVFCPCPRLTARATVRPHGMGHSLRGRGARALLPSRGHGLHLAHVGL